MSSDYPIRAQTHMSESRSLALLRQCLPDRWVVRDVGERDYGLDVYVEIVGEDNRLRGDLVAIQLKSQNEVKFNLSSIRKYTTLRSVKRTTLNYWLGMPVPVFLCLVCLSSQRCYWVNIKRRFREGHYSSMLRVSAAQGKGVARNPPIKIEAVDNFSPHYLNRFLKSYEIERKWPEIESAIQRGLTAYTSLGPLVLMCKRRNSNERCSSTLQYLINSHWETFCTLLMYFEGEQSNEVSSWYEKSNIYAEKNGLPQSYTLYFHAVSALFDEMLDRYLTCLLMACKMVLSTHKEYFDRRYPLLRTHLEHRPLTFVMEDWYSRYYFDEYEVDARHPEELFFEDFDEYDGIIEDYPFN